ncbi:hypothetical protein [Mesorhizobium amorphae]|uniref:hypothetical protein n=1 Tax=Mesorhizobium amorphae TaxID=71433 RepID=UPI0024E12901|nr:hypothetical protein [Mesorhizobium amorphae]
MNTIDSRRTGRGGARTASRRSRLSRSPVQRGDEHGALHGKAELTAGQQIPLRPPEPLSHPSKQQGAANPAGGDAAGIDVGNDEAAFAVPGDRCGEPVEFVAGASLRPSALIVRRRPSRNALYQVKVPVGAVDSLDNHCYPKLAGIEPFRPLSCEMLLLHVGGLTNQLTQNQ